MGLDTTHDCWHGPYSAFNRWRTKLCEVAGYGDLEEYAGFGGSTPWPMMDPLAILLSHSDCDGEIRWQDCENIANALHELITGMTRADTGRPLATYTVDTLQFISGLTTAHARKENVRFE